MAVVRWTFYDPGSGDTYEFHINPNTGGSLPFKKNFMYHTTAAPDGKTLIFQGRPEIQTLEFSGTILEQAHFDAFVAWWRMQNQVRITDDLGRQFWAVIQDFEPQRVASAIYAWKHTYTCRAVIVDWPS